MDGDMTLNILDFNRQDVREFYCSLVKANYIFYRVINNYISLLILYKSNNSKTRLYRIYGLVVEVDFKNVEESSVIMQL